MGNIFYTFDEWSKRDSKFLKIRFTFTIASPKKTDDIRRVFIMLRNRDFARCGASCRLRREPRLVKLSENKEGKAASVFRLTKNGAKQGARRLDKQFFL